MFLDHVVLVFTSGYTWIPLYLSLLYLVVKNNERWGRILLIMGTMALCMLVSNVGNGGFVKPYIARLRPSSDPLLAHSISLVCGYTPEGFSFFSAHACNAFSVAVFFPSRFSYGLALWHGHDCTSACTFRPTFSWVWWLEHSMQPCATLYINRYNTV